MLYLAADRNVGGGGASIRDRQQQQQQLCYTCTALRPHAAAHRSRSCFCIKTNPVQINPFLTAKEMTSDLAPPVSLYPGVPHGGEGERRAATVGSQ